MKPDWKNDEHLELANEELNELKLILVRKKEIIGISQSLIVGLILTKLFH